ncbi:MAG: hypothetical protein ACK4IY_10105, partial [Chitinophagales bacterium]
MSTPVFEWIFITKLQMQTLSATVIYFITAACIFFQGILISIFLRYFKILPKLNFIPAAIFYSLYYMFDEILVFSPLLILHFFLLALLAVLFSAYNAKTADNTFFNTGLINGAIALFYSPAVVFSLFTLYAAFTLRSSSLRELFIFITGFFTLLFLVFTTCFWFDNTSLMANSLLIPLS